MYVNSCSLFATIKYWLKIAIFVHHEVVQVGCLTCLMMKMHKELFYFSTGDMSNKTEFLQQMLQSM